VVFIPAHLPTLDSMPSAPTTTLARASNVVAAVLAPDAAYGAVLLDEGGGLGLDLDFGARLCGGFRDGAVEYFSFQDVADFLAGHLLVKLHAGPVRGEYPGTGDLGADPPGVRLDKLGEPDLAGALGAPHRVADLLALLDQKNVQPLLRGRPCRDGARGPAPTTMTS